MKWNEELLHFEDDKIKRIQSYWAKLTPGYNLTASGISELKKLLQKYSIEEVLSAMQKASMSYIQWNNGSPTKESVNIAWSKVAGICSLSQADFEDPDLKEFFYIRGIIRNRLTYYVPHLTIDWLRAARSWGASISELKDIALRVNSWTHFSAEIDNIIAEYKSINP
jgi:hypothetical protein